MVTSPYVPSKSHLNTLTYSTENEQTAICPQFYIISPEDFNEIIFQRFGSNAQFDRRFFLNDRLKSLKQRLRLEQKYGKYKKNNQSIIEMSLCDAFFVGRVTDVFNGKRKRISLEIMDGFSQSRQLRVETDILKDYYFFPGQVNVLIASI